MTFHDRTDEIALLEERWTEAADSHGQLFVIWGRRRVGKTELVAEFLRTKRAALFEATSGTESDQLADLARVLGQLAPDSPLLGAQPFASWDVALAVIAELCRNQPLALALDEYQHLAAANPNLGSILANWWGATGRHLPLMLILSGSAVSFFERDVMGHSSPLYGRRTGQLEVHPLGYRDAALFTPDYSATDRIRTFAVCGGVPYYLEQFDRRRPVLDNIRSAVLSRSGVLREEARLLLFEELPDPRTYFSVLRSLASGDTRVSEISNRSGLKVPDVTKYLAVLQQLKLVRRLVPAGTTTRARTRLTSYELADPYLRFWFRFVAPYEERLIRPEMIDRHLSETIAPRFDEFVSKPAFEEVCRSFMLLATDAVEVGPWWGPVPTGVARRTEQREVDCVALDAERRVLALGTCKWTNEAMPASEEALLSRLQPYIADGVTERVPHFFFARSGFAPELIALAKSEPLRYLLIGPDELFAEIVRL